MNILTNNIRHLKYFAKLFFVTLIIVSMHEDIVLFIQSKRFYSVSGIFGDATSLSSAGKLTGQVTGEGTHVVRRLSILNTYVKML